MIQLNEIPHSWTSTNLGSVCKLRNGFAFKSDRYTKEGIPVIRISDIGDGKVDLEYCVKVELENHYLDYKVRKGDILVAMSGATTGKFGIFKNDQLAFQNQRVGRFEILDDSLLNNQFLLFLLYGLKHKILEDAYGGAQPNISSGKIEEMVIPLPPIAEQQCIVFKIEELFSELDKGIETLKTAQQQLKIYRQAVLKYAFEGKLTYPNVKEGELPEGWRNVKSGDIIDFINSGSTPMKQFMSDNIGDIPFLKVYNLNFDGTLNHTKNPVFITKAIHEGKMKRSICIPGDVLINIVGPPLGKISVVTNHYPEWNINQAIVAFRPNSKIRPKYLSYHLQNNVIIQWLEGTSKATAGQWNVKVSTCREIPLNIPANIEEQDQIVQEIESRLSVCDKIEESIVQGLQQAEALRQSILKKVFEGKLVPQDPNDEPASVLLERIKAERGKNAQPEKKSIKKKKII